MGKSKNNTVPDRWLAYTPVGKQITGTRFITFKVPLKLQISTRIPEDEQFMPATLIEKVPNLKCIVDLTNTDRYYDSYEFTKHGIKYVKIACVGRELPSPSTVKRFFEVVDQFLNENPDGLIGVHCTHGINRTGYFVCRYMIERMMMDTEIAMSLFNEARGHQMERYVYINDLKCRYKYDVRSLKDSHSTLTLTKDHTQVKKSKYYQNPALKSFKNNNSKYFTAPRAKIGNFPVSHNGVLEEQTQAQTQIPFGNCTVYYPPTEIPSYSQNFYPSWTHYNSQYNSVNSNNHLQSSSDAYGPPYVIPQRQNCQSYGRPSSSSASLPRDIHNVTDATEVQPSYTSYRKSTLTMNRQFGNSASNNHKKHFGNSKKPLLYNPTPSIREDSRKYKESASQPPKNKGKYYRNPKLTNPHARLTNTQTDRNTTDKFVNKKR